MRHITDEQPSCDHMHLWSVHTGRHRHRYRHRQNGFATHLHLCRCLCQCQPVWTVLHIIIDPFFIGVCACVGVGQCEHSINAVDNVIFDMAGTCWNQNCKKIYLKSYHLLMYFCILLTQNPYCTQSVRKKNTKPSTTKQNRFFPTRSHLTGFSYTSSPTM